jgi:predicted amidohydrolase
LENGSFRNRACIFAPNGRWDFQEKLIMTRFENEEWKISPGTEIRVFDISPGAVEIRVGICICYDVEFPMIARKEVEAGATVILVPSCTDSRTGYHRVRLAAQARALENQCYVIQATTVGKALWSPALDENTGAAGVFSPVDFGFPEDGVLAAGYPDLPQWVYADLNLQMISEVRSTGQTLNHHDWEKQHPLLTRMVPEVRLTGRPE